MISRRTFLKRLGQFTLIAAASPTVLAEMVMEDAPLKGVLGPLLEKIRKTGPAPYYAKFDAMILPASEYDRLLQELDAGTRFADRKLSERGFENLIIKGVPIVRN